MNFDDHFKTILNHPHQGYISHKRERHIATWNAAIEEARKAAEQLYMGIHSPYEYEKNVAEEIEKLKA